MKRWKKYLLIGIAVYLVVLVGRFPAELAYALARPSLASADAPLELYKLSGSVWHGEAAYAEISGQDVRKLRWELKPLELLVGQTAMRVSLQSDAGTMSSHLARSFGGDLKLEDVKARIGMNELLTMLNIPAIKLGGRLSINLQALEVEGNVITHAAGKLVWNGAATQFPQKLDLGDLSANITTTGQGVEIDISDAGGPLSAAGKLVIEPNGAYKFNGQFGAREGVNSMLGRSLSMMGRPGADGSVQVATSGNLADFGFLIK